MPNYGGIKVLKPINTCLFFKLDLKQPLAILGYQTLFSAFFEPVAIAFDIDGNAVV